MPCGKGFGDGETLPKGLPNGLPKGLPISKTTKMRKVKMQKIIIIIVMIHTQKKSNRIY